MSETSWAALIEGMLEAVWILDPVSLHITAVNQAAARMLGVAAADLIGRSVVELTVTPEDLFFWEEVMAGLTDNLLSETLMRHADGHSVQVERRVSKVWLSAGQAVFVVAMHDLSEQRRVDNEMEKLVAELRATLESTADGILVIDLKGAVRNYNHRFAELWDLPEDLLLQRDDAALQRHLSHSVLDPLRYAERSAEIAAAPLLESSDVLVLRRGRVLEQVTLPQLSRGRPIGRVFSFRDITQQLANEARLQLAAKVFESSLDAIFITGAGMQMVAVNPSCQHMTGCSSDELLQRRADSLFFDPLDSALSTHIQVALDRHGYWEGEVWHRRSDGSACAAQLSWVCLRDTTGPTLHTIGFFRDLSEKNAAKKRIEQLAYSDALTGLPNRLLLGQRVGVALSMAQRKGGHLAILFIDLDRFKTINDSLGHIFGDRVLIEVAKRIDQCLRQVDTLSRMGGDEFVVFLNGADARGAEVTARRVLDALAQPFALDGISFSVGCSIGIAVYPTDGDSLDDLIKCADAAMYQVKEHGRGNFRFYQPQMNVDLLSRMKMEHAMRQAMEQRRFRLHYQPKVSLQGGGMMGAEALIRWHDEQFGEVSPALFIALAEESGFIITIGNWVLESAVAQAARWQRDGLSTVIAVNVSALQFQQSDFVWRVASALEREALDPHALELELTESILVQGVDEALERLRALAALGVGLSIDDFGVGYSSLAYLKKFPIHKLKIDRSFIMGLPDNESDLAIVSAILSLGRALGLLVIAEGVETAAQRDLLRQLGCDQYQGFLYSKGVPAAAFEEMLRSDRALLGPAVSRAAP